MKPPRLSVIIPCLNEAEYVPKLLQDLIDQDIEEPFEVIVADSSSDDGTLEATEQFSDQLNLRTTNTDRMSAGHTRNAGAEVASGDYFLFLDADCHIRKHFLRELMHQRDQHGADMMTTRFMSTGFHPWDRFMYNEASAYLEGEFRNGNYLMSGCCQFVSKHIHEQINGFNKELIIDEDLDYSRRAREVANQPHFLNKLRVSVSNRRFKSEGRITMFLRRHQWSTGEQLEIESVDDFDFGEHDVIARRITVRDVLTNPKLSKIFLRASWALAKNKVHDWMP